MLVGIQNEILRLHAMKLLKPLLVDRTTGTNIIWATDAYNERGSAYQRDKEIQVDLITGSNSDVIKNRARKALEQQSERTRQHAEVFTPLWICRKMVSYADEIWFEGKDPFSDNIDSSGKIEFPKKKKWKRYIDQRRLEITSGEAPYLVNRYDVATGEEISIEKRQGILDRKLRVVNENAADEDEWLLWTLRAYQQTYGYEFQGDNLLIARLNLLMTYEEFLREKWNRKPTIKEYKEIIKTITWNVWQMDGLTGTVPYCKAQEEFHQVNMFELLGCDEESSEQNQIKQQPYSRIWDWRRGNSLEYIKVNTGGRNMKFDFVIGNPPYNTDFADSGNNGNFAKPLYNDFMDAANNVAEKVELIHPARFLFNAGSTPKAWNTKMLNDPHFKVLSYEEDASKFFSNTEIKGGIAITYHDNAKDFGAIRVFTKYPELNSITKKAAPQDESGSITSIIYTQNRFNLEVVYAEYPEVKACIGSDGKDKRFRNNTFDKVPLFSEVAKDDSDIAVFGVIKNKRCWRFIPCKFVDKTHENLNNYKVIVPRANGKGVISDVLSSPIVLDPNEAYTQTFIGIGAFNSKDEAENALKYIKSKFARALLSVLKVDQHNEKDTWEKIPLQDFTSSSDIDWSKSIAEIDHQLYAKYNLDDKEIAFIESHVKEMA